MQGHIILHPLCLLAGKQFQKAFKGQKMAKQFWIAFPLSCPITITTQTSYAAVAACCGSQADDDVESICDLWRRRSWVEFWLHCDFGLLNSNNVASLLMLKYIIMFRISTRRSYRNIETPKRVHCKDLGIFVLKEVLSHISLEAITTQSFDLWTNFLRNL